MADEEYFRRLTPQPEYPHGSGHSGNPFESMANGSLDVTSGSGQQTPTAEDERIQQVAGRQPTIVHHQPRVISAEGLVGSIHDDSAVLEETSPKITDVEPQTPDTPASEPELVTVQRAQSIDLGKGHARHLSAGSARLLDIRRASTTSHSKMLEQA